MATLTFYYDITCPYAYLGSTQVQAFADAMELDLVWRPILLGGVYRALQAPQEPARSMPAAKARLNSLDLLRQADRLGQQVAWHPDHPVRSVSAMRLLIAASDAVRPALTADLYRTYWVEHGNISDRPTLERVARRHGLSLDVIDQDEVKQALFESTAEAVELGGFGVPIFRVQAQGMDRFWWGTDRLPLVAQALGRSWDPVPARVRQEHVPPITFFHDFSSPFSYLGATQIERLAHEEGTTVEWVPILLGALFTSIGTPDVPLFAMNRNKSSYFLRDLQDWAHSWGVPFQMQSHFPVRTVTALRVALIEPDVTPCIYRAIWAEDRNVSDPAVLRAVLDEAGFDGAGLIAGTQDPAIKARLRTNTERAEREGVCGVPTSQVHGMLFWGQDRLEQVRAALRGWRSPADVAPQGGAGR